MYRLLAAVLVFPLATAATAADLKRIERRIAEEPVYQTKTPRYCLLVFGEKAQQRVWLVEDGNALFFDRNGNGDLTEPGERVVSISASGRVFRPGHLDQHPGLPRYTNFWINCDDKGYEIVLCVGASLRNGRRLFVGFDPPGQFRFTDRAAEAPIVHFDGPLELRLMAPPTALTAGQETKLEVVLGTPGLGAGTFAKHGLQKLIPVRAEFDFAGAAGEPATLAGHEG
jgi:hypothetical protein